MKKRHLRVTVHVVAGLRPDPGSNGMIVDLPDEAVQFAFLNETTAAAAIRQKLYEVFTRQVNVWFDMQPPDPAVKVLLLEAGPRDWHPFVHMPAGLAKLVTYVE